MFLFSEADIVRRVNISLDNNTVKETHTLIQKPEGKFPKVLNRSAFLYHDELCKVKKEILRVRFVSLNIFRESKMKKSS